MIMPTTRAAQTRGPPLAVTRVAALGKIHSTRAIGREDVLDEPQTIMIPGGTLTLPLAGALLVTAVVTVILLWIADSASAAAAAAGRRRAEERLAQKIDDMRQELSDQILALSYRLDERRSPAGPPPTPPRERVAR